MKDEIPFCQLFSKAANSLRESLMIYYPGGHVGRDLKERNLTAYFSRALFESDYKVWHEAIVSPGRPKESLDLLALSPDQSYLIKCEAKRLYAVHKFEEVRRDIEKMSAFAPFGNHQDSLPANHYSVVIASCWDWPDSRFIRRWRGEALFEENKWSRFRDELAEKEFQLGAEKIRTEERELWFLWAVRHDKPSM